SALTLLSSLYVHLTSLLSSFSTPHSAAPWLATLSLHDALPICRIQRADIPDPVALREALDRAVGMKGAVAHMRTYRHKGPNMPKIGRAHRLNSSHLGISYAVFCLKKKKKHEENMTMNI